MENKELTMQDRLEALKDNRFHIHRVEIAAFAENNTADPSDDTDWINAAAEYAVEHGWGDYKAEYNAWMQYVRRLSGIQQRNYFDGK